MKMNKRGQSETGIMFFCVVMFIVLTILLIFWNPPFEQRKDFCEDRGFETKDSHKNNNITGVENGYILCCRDKVVNHYIVGKDCGMFKYKQEVKESRPKPERVKGY